MKYAKYVRTQYTEHKYDRHGTYIGSSCRKSEREEKRNLIEMTGHEEIPKILETVFTNMKNAGYSVDSYEITVAFSKGCDEHNDVVQVIKLDDQR